MENKTSTNHENGNDANRLLADAIRKRWQTKLIDTKTVLSACEKFHKDKDERAPWRIIMEETGAPEKVVYAAMEREERRGYLDYGVSLRTSWLTDKGKAFLYGCV
jgi:hypothetical protein